MSFLINKCFFIIGSLAFKQYIGIPGGIDPALFWANLFKFKFIKQLISNGSSKTFKYHRVSTFIDGLCAIKWQCKNMAVTYLS